MEEVIGILEDKGITVNKYTENNILCGYELNTYTDGDVNMIIRLDFRYDGDPLDKEHFISKFNHYLNKFDIDYEIDRYRESHSYKSTFTVRQSLEDFEAWQKEMREIVEELNV